MANQSADAAFGVSRSASGQLWRLRDVNPREILHLTQRLGVSELLARLLAVRQISADAAPQFLEPRLRYLLPDPSSLADMDKAATRLAEAIESGEAAALCDHPQTEYTRELLAAALAVEAPPV